MEAVKTVFCILAVTMPIAIITVSCDVSKRNVTVTAWPNCGVKEECEKIKSSGLNIVYAKAIAPNDSLLYAFSTIGMPTIILAHVTGAETDMYFNWTKLLNGTSIENAITINETSSKVDYMFGVAFTRLIEYNDTKDDADIKEAEKRSNDTSYWKMEDFESFNWVIGPNITSDTFIFNASSDNNIKHDISPLVGNWSISFTFKMPQDSGRSTELPSLKYGVNETLMDFVLANYTPEYSKSRFAIEAVLVSQSSNKEMKIETIDSIDDEYSPGVFQIVNWLSNPSAQHSSGFFQWKPICYTNKYRSRSTGTKVKHYDLSGLENNENMTTLLNKSLIYALFGNTLYETSVIIQTTNISFGLSDDGYYDQTNYTAWSAAIGYGLPPTDTISLTVIIIISAGLGLPVILLLFGGIYTCVKKARRKIEYEVIDSVNRTQPLVN